MQVSFNDSDGQKVRFMINDQSDKPTLDYCVGNEIKLRGLTSLIEKDGTIEVVGCVNVDEEEQKMEPVKVTPASNEDMKRVLALAAKIGLVSRPAVVQEIVEDVLFMCGLISTTGTPMTRAGHCCGRKSATAAGVKYSGSFSGPC